MTMEAAKGLLRLNGSASQPKGLHAESLGFRPRALLLWWSLQAEPGTAPGNRGGIGVAADGGEQAAVAWTAADGSLAGGLGMFSGDDAFLGVDDPSDSSAGLRGRVSWLPDGFSLERAAGAGTAWHVHYLALGGSDLHGAAVRRFELAESGLQRVTGVGFAPDFLVFIPAAGSAGRIAETAVVNGIGVACGPDSQAASAFAVRVGKGTTSVSGTQRTDAVVALPSLEPAAGLRALARLVSCDEDGFSLESMISPASPVPITCLALAGGSYRMGVSMSPTSAGKTVEHVGFEPSALLAFAWGLAASAETKDIGRLGLGAASARANGGSVSWAVRNRQVWPLVSMVNSTVDGLVDVLDTKRGGYHARAVLGSLDPDGFSLDWAVADQTQRECVYVAFGPA
jgi:hypothetical protein